MNKKAASFVDTSFVSQFRVWDGKQMLYQNGFTFGPEKYSLAYMLSDIEVVPMQYLFKLKDVMFFEGDIVKFKNLDSLFCIRRVGFNFYLVDVKAKNVKSAKIPFPDNLNVLQKIGNVFENFDLIS